MTFDDIFYGALSFVIIAGGVGIIAFGLIFILVWVFQ